MKSEPPATNTAPNEQPKKNYNTPKLVQYGNIREITKALGGVTGMNDGGGGKDKTA
ncbi:MAG TPA: lasso peptide [Pyrinomonadaceae bacterium]|nr:lasso peptide [Pyrinomonadaceae bacterium]